MAKGGKREGAGRKPLPKEEQKVNVCIKLKPEVAKRLRERAKQDKTTIGNLIESLL